MGFIMIFSACQSENNRKVSTAETKELFTLLNPAQTKIGFRNSVVESNAFNFINYVYIYNGGGVAIGDINNDGLDDIYLSSNQGMNKLYLNKGKMVFEDITNTSGTADDKGWSTGVSMVDVNNDGLLDIYVCKSASRNNNALRRNKLFVNQGNNKFIESASAYGLADQGFSTQSYFFDYDKDGDLDMYLVNHRADFINNNAMNPEIQRAIVPEFSDKLYRNDGGRYNDVSAMAGIVNKNWDLSAAIADYNDDGWLDIYVCNDFTEPDQLWINNTIGGFEDKVLDHMDHISYYSMGSDVADINNDGKEDLIVVDMVSEDHKRSKQNMAAMSTFQFNTMVANNYHHQYMANMLQLNRGQGVFSEIAHLAGVPKTDWSWAPLFADFDGDGNKDLFVTNGIKREMTDNDYKNRLSERSAQGQMH
ncbi:MAG: VCBS repeat-containing protein, partial [Bacteroidia bacterium]|nr:VCBS repeat-containing protein [Bacteroidia bacterium]